MQKYDPIKKILDREKFCADLKYNVKAHGYAMMLWFFLIVPFYALAYCAFCFWLSAYAIFVHIVFIAIGVLVFVPLGKRLARILMLARMLKADRYVIKTDVLTGIGKQEKRGMHLTTGGVRRGLRWEPILEDALYFEAHGRCAVETAIDNALSLKHRGRVLIEQNEFELFSGGDKFYLVLPADKPDRIVLCYNADRYELDI